MREDIEMKGHAKELGFMVTGDVDRGDSLTFRKSNTVIWRIRDGWQVADLVSGYYKNHRPCSTLKEALEKEA